MVSNGDERVEELLAALRELLRWVDVPDSAMGDDDWRKRREAIANAGRLISEHNTGTEPK